MTHISPKADIDATAKIGSNVVIGPFVYVGPNVTLEDNVKLWPQTGIGENTVIGEGTQVYPKTTIGYNCVIGKHVEFMGSNIPGHVNIEDFAVLSDCSVHQFDNIGKGAFVGSRTPIRKDVLPYLAFAQAKGIVKPVFLNKLGAKRAKLTPEEMADIKRAYAIFFSSIRQGMLTSEALEEIKQRKSLQHPEIQNIVSFIEKSTRGIYMHKRDMPLHWIEPADLYQKNDMYWSKKRIK